MQDLTPGGMRGRLLLLVFVAAVPALGLAVHSGLEQRGRALDEARRNTLQVLRLATEGHATLIAGVEQLLAALARVPAVRDLDVGRCNAVLAGVLAGSPHLTNVSAVSPGGDVTCAALPLPGPVNLADRPYFRHAIETRRFTIGQYAVGRATGRPSLFVAHPALDQAGTVTAVLTAGVDPSWLSAVAARARLPDGAAFGLVDRSGVLLVRHPDPAAWIGQPIPNRDRILPVLEREREGALEGVGVDGVARVFTFTTVAGSGPGWHVFAFIGIPKAQVVAGAERGLRRDLLWVGAAMALMLALAWIGADLLVLRPGRRLLEATRRVAAGDLAARSGPPYGGGEVGELARAFDDMAAALGSRQLEAEAAREALAASGARHRMLVEEAVDGIIVFDGEGRLLDANPRACEQLGYAKDDLLSRRAGDFAVPEERADSARRLETLKATGSLTVERRLLRKDGSVLHAELRHRRLPDGSFQATVRDITRQKAAEAQALALADAGRALMGPLDAEGVGRRIVAGALAVVRGRRAALYRLDPMDPRRLVAFVAAGEPMASDWVGQAIPLGVSLTGFAAAERRPATSVHVRRDPRFPPGEWARTRLVDDDCHAWVSVPLIAGGELIGALSVGDTSGRQFAEAEVHVLAGFAGPAAVALRNAELFARSEQRRTEAEALARTGRDLAERLDIAAVADRAVRGVQALLACSSASLRLLAPDGGLVRVAASGPDAARLTLGHVLPPGQGMASRALTEGRSVQAPDILAEPGLVLPDDLGREHAESGKVAVLAIPLRASGTAIGALTLAHEAGRVFSDDEVGVAEAFASQAAVALHNARLHEDFAKRTGEAEQAAEAARRYAARLELLREISEAILHARAPATIASAALDRLRQIIPAERAVVALYDLHAGRGTWLAVTGIGQERAGAGVSFPLAMMGDLGGLARGQRQRTSIDTVRNEEAARLLAAVGIHSFAVIPLVCDGELIGSLNFGMSTDTVIAAEHVELATEVAGPLAVAIRQARLLEETERRRAEAETAEAGARRVAEALRESEASLATAQERARLGSWEFDLRTRRARWSREMFRLYGRDPALGEPGLAGFMHHIHPEDRAELARLWTLTLESGEETSLDYRTNTELGPVRHFNTTIHRSTGAGGEPVALGGTVLDVTERVLAEQEVRLLNVELEQRVRERTARLAEVNAEMEAFAYSVAHDLRAPLRAMQGLSQALVEDYADRLDATGRDYAGRVMAAAHSMDELIQDLLAYGRLSREEARLEPVGWRAVVGEARGQLGAALAGATVEVGLPDSLPEVLAHRATVVQVVANLLGNAVKFVAPGVTPRVRVWAEERGERVRLWVEDNGIGIAPEHQERIFRVFERLHGRESYPGTGIGLAIVRKGMERMGGGCGVESTPGQGSRFWVELPRAGSPSMAAR